MGACIIELTCNDIDVIDTNFCIKGKEKQITDCNFNNPLGLDFYRLGRSPDLGNNVTERNHTSLPKMWV